MTPFAQSAYGRNAVLTATPAQLLTMLYDRLLLDLSRAQATQQAEQWHAASEQLLHAQAIVTELIGSLRVEAWDGADQLLALYQYVLSALVNANVHRDGAQVTECIELLEPLRRAWHDAAAAHTVVPATPTTGWLGDLGVA
ncbi:flagellar export chaperone FliS [Georgenia sp. AZ-5]|uniref:flagellar export chaperone FliS n=1 Tax=Georgenia sp. AZ-5 TaxID=3367526 RepID=UPI003754C620